MTFANAVKPTPVLRILGYRRSLNNYYLIVLQGLRRRRPLWPPAHSL